MPVTDSTLRTAAAFDVGWVVHARSAGAWRGAAPLLTLGAGSGRYVPPARWAGAAECRAALCSAKAAVWDPWWRQRANDAWVTRALTVVLGESFR